MPLAPGLNVINLTGRDTAGTLLFENSINITAPASPQLSVQLGNGILHLTWDSESGAQYILEQSDDLSNWSQTQTATPDGTEASIDVPQAIVHQRFYRVRLAP